MYFLRPAVGLTRWLSGASHLTVWTWAILLSCSLSLCWTPTPWNFSSPATCLLHLPFAGPVSSLAAPSCPNQDPCGCHLLFHLFPSSPAPYPVDSVFTSSLIYYFLPSISLIVLLLNLPLIVILLISPPAINLPPPQPFSQVSISIIFKSINRTMSLHYVKLFSVSEILVVINAFIHVFTKF